MKGYRVQTVAVAAALLAACQTVPEKRPPVQLDAAQVKQQFAGKTVESFNLITGVTSFTYYQANGSLTQHRLWETYHGKWKVQNDGAICLAIRSKQYSCRYVFDDNGRFYKYRPGEGGGMEKVIRYRQFIEGNAL